MPELPEVETVRITLLPRILNQKIVSVQALYDKMIVNDTVETFSSKLIGETFHGIERRGKYLIFILTNYKLISHLRMEGKYFIKDSTIPISKHEHMIFFLESGESLRYHDTRKFGTMEVLGFEQISKTGLSTLGYEPFDEGFSWTYLKELLHHSNRPIKAGLLDQSVVSGLGNIYVDEVLYSSKVHPARLCSSITDKEFKNIAISSKNILQKAIDLGGASVHSFSYGDGITGRFQNELNVHTHADELCKKCSTVLEKTKVAGRTSYFCPKCQRM